MKKVNLILVVVLAFCMNTSCENTKTVATDKVLLVLPSNHVLENGEESIGFSLSSVIEFFGFLKNKGVQIDFATPMGGSPKIDQQELSDVYNYGAVAHYFKSSHLHEKLEKTKPFDALNPSNYNAVVCIGGLASVKDFSENKTLHKIIRKVYEAGGVIASLDNGLSALMNVTLSDGSFLVNKKKVTSLSQTELLAALGAESKEDLLKLVKVLPQDVATQNGALFQNEAAANQMFRSRVIEDERVITAGYQASSAGLLAKTVYEKTRKPAQKILIVVTSNDQLLNGSPAGFYLPEVTDFHYVLSNGGNFDFDIASPKGGKAPMYNESGFLNIQPYQTYLLETGLLAKLYNTIPLSDINPEDYDAIHFAGGFASLTDFPKDENLKNITRDIYEKDGIVSAVCHGPSALLNVTLSNGKNLLDGLRVTSRTVEEETANGAYTKEQILQNFPIILEDEIRSQKAIFTKGDSSEGHIESDKRVITGQGVPSTTPLAKEMLRQLTEV